MVLTQPFLPTCEELDLLDAHLHELEEPGTTFLQDFIVAPPLMPSDTPLSTSSGYTSEESDHSIMTGSDEFLQCRGMSFLQAAKTSELVDVVEDLSAQDLMAVSPRSQQHYQHFTGMGVKSKTSKYRGVTQTSKTSWGAKYSAKRITNTCKTPEEAARAYDKYLETNFPQKFAKFANFCHKCDKFVNPLGLPQYQSECVCSSSSPIGSPLSEAASMSLKKEIDTEQQVTSPTATLPLVPPMAPSPAGVPSTLNMMDVLNHRSDVDPANEQSTTFVGRCSNNMSGSLKFSFSDGAERPFAQSYDSGTKILQNQDGAALTEVQQQGQDKMYDSLPMTAISSAVDSFTLGDNLDQIIKDINHPPSFQSLLNRSVAEERVANDNARICPTAIRSSSGIGKMSESATYDTILVEPATPNSLGFDVDELDELTNYFLSENDVTVAVQREMHADPISTEQHPVVKEERSRQFKKIHSLDFDCENTTDSDAAMNDVKLEDAGGTFLAIPVGVNSSGSTPPGSSSSATIDIQTQFLEKYWRNDRKNIQCFPYCPEHGDYYRVRIEDLQHQCKGVCHAPVKARVSIPAPAGASVVKTGLTVLARCNSSFSQQKALTEQQLLSSAEMKSLQGVSTIGVISQFTPVRNGTGGVQFDVMFHPDVWKFEFALPKKRRHIQSSNRALSSDDSVASGGSTAAEFLYFFEIDVFYSRGRTSFERLGHTKSANFRIGNTRTLLRQRNKRVGEMCCSEEPQTYVGGCDNDKMISVDDLPEKKKVKVHLGQRELLSGASFSDDSARSGCELAESKLLSDCATGEDISSSSKLSLPTVKPTCMDGDRCIKTDSKDSTCDRKPGLLDLPHADSDVWKNMNASSVGTQQTAASDYRSYVSPKQKHGSVQMADSLVATSTSFTRSTNERPAASTSSAVTESYSLPELLRYSLACAPLSLLFMPVGILLTLVFVIVPLAASNVVGALDSLSDMELSRANRSCISRDRRLVLSRLVEEKGDSDKKPSGGGLFRYHVNGKVWYRLFYFSGAKSVVSMISLVPALLLALFAGLLYPIRSVSGVIGNAASSCALWSREYTRTTTGMPLSGDIVDYDATDGRV